jgi:hypothetical protein
MTQEQLTNEVQELNRNADTIIVRNHDITTMHEVLQERADERRKEQERASYNSALSNGLLQA